MTAIRFVVGTRENNLEDFQRKTLTGRGLSMYESFFSFEVRVFLGNSRGLPEIYNLAIDESERDPALLIFMHDDVYLTDYFWAQQILAGLDSFDIIGVAGNRRRVPRQPAWFLLDLELNWDARENLSGAVGAGEGIPTDLFTYYGKPGVAVELLDGVLLAARSDTLTRHGLRFDERFLFDFYDLDFCREARRLGLRLGTWPISILHRSGGAFGTRRWHDAYAEYLSKWGD